MKEGFCEAVVSVEHLTRVAETLHAVAGWSWRPLRPAPPEQRAAWKLEKSGAPIEQVLIEPDGDERGRIRLVRVGDPDAVHMRSSSHIWDTGGIFDLDVYVRDCAATFRELQRHGWSGFGNPADYQWSGFPVREVLATGPDGVVLAMIETEKVAISLPSYRHISRVFNSSQAVRDLDASLDFYIGKLGWKAFVTMDVRNAVEPGRNVLGVPMPLAETMRRRVAIVHPSGTNDGSVELISLPELAGHDFASRCVAPNIGHLSLRFPVTDSLSEARRLTHSGVPLYTEPMHMVIEPFGEVDLFSVQSPDGALLEFFSPA